MKTIHFMISLAIILTLALTGCNFTFNSFEQVDYVGTGQEFELILNISDNGVGAGGDNKTAMVGLRLPDGCAFVKGNVSDENWFTGSINNYQNLSESAYVTSFLDNISCPARVGYQWFGYKGSHDWNPGDWQVGQVILNCSNAGSYELDVAIGTFHWNITDYFCNNSFEVFTGSGTTVSPYGIHTCDGFEAMEVPESTGHYQMNNDINCAGSNFDGVQNDFYGSFDGQGYTISNADFTGTHGMFKFAYDIAGSDGANISNVKLDNITATGGQGTGALIGEAGYGRTWNIEVANSYIECSSRDCGGAIGELRSSSDYVYNLTVHHSVINCSSENVGGVLGECDMIAGLLNSLLYSYENEVYGTGYVGGICGDVGTDVSQVRVVNTTIVSTGTATGGAFGFSDSNRLSEVYLENIDLTCTQHCGGAIGRLAYESLSNVIAHNITTDSTGHTGGIVGYMTFGGDLSNALLTKYTATTTNENRTGIIAGYVTNSANEIQDVYYHNINIDVIDICGNDSADFTYCNPTYVHAETESNLKLEATYTNWDFITVFGINPGDYPHFLFDPLSCTQDWSCTGYASCNISDLAPCDTVVDGNACQQNYTGDYSEFSPQACDYCANDLDLLVLGACDLDAGIRSDLYEDLNFGTCCNVTSNPSDCAFGNATQGYINNSCTTNYQSEYESSDVVKVVIDFIVTWGIGIVALIGVIALIFVFKFVRKNVKK